MPKNAFDYFDCDSIDLTEKNWFSRLWCRSFDWFVGKEIGKEVNVSFGVL